MTSPPSATPDPAPSLYLEDFRLGMRHRSGDWIADAGDLRAFGEVSGDLHPMHLDPERAATSGYPGLVAQGPLGLARYFGTLHESGIVADTVLGLLDTHWRYLLPVTTDTKMHYETTVTSVRRTSAGDRGVVDRHIELKDDAGRVLQWGTSAFLVRARSSTAGAGEAAAAPVTLEWGRALAERLAADADFAASAQLFDGSIALASEKNTIQFRIYRGEILEVTRRTPAGPTFTVHGTERAWAELLTADRNDFVVRAHRGEFSAGGNAYVYLQMTSTLHRLVETARTMTSLEAPR